jgi:naphtho-gamma-pyrone polyketide synthase
MAMTVVDYMLKATNMQTDTTSIDVGDMKATRPLLLNNSVNSQMLRISATADWSAKTASVVFYSANSQGKKTTEHATCVVRICDNSTWLQDWKRNSYLIKSRIQSLQKAVDGGDGDSTHKMKTGLVYKLFSTLVDYDPRYKGIQEAVLDSNELEATAQVTFQVGDEGFLFHPCWVDSLGQIAGFIMNGNDNVHSKENVFINHGWDAIKVVDVKKFQHGKTYQTYNRMQLESGTNYVGDTYILDGDEIMAVYEGIKVCNFYVEQDQN